MCGFNTVPWSSGRGYLHRDARTILMRAWLDLQQSAAPGTLAYELQNNITFYCAVCGVFILVANFSVGREVVYIIQGFILKLS